MQAENLPHGKRAQQSKDSGTRIIGFASHERPATFVVGKKALRPRYLQRIFLRPMFFNHYEAMKGQMFFAQ
jgi:hypothetical protein